MNTIVLYAISTIFMGLGATLTFDLWTLFLKYAFRIPPSNFCLVGRWTLYLPEGIVRHSNIGSAPRKSRECIVGWIAHYMTGITFAVCFIAFVDGEWLQHPILIPALIFGMVTVLVPFFIMQPAFGLGIAASKTSNPLQASLRSLVNHIVFGIGLYLFGWLVSRLLSLN
jgi:hypothetical protein